MKIVRFEHQGANAYGAMEGDTIHPITGSIFADQITLSDQSIPLSAVRLLVPCEPTKIVGVGLNYRDHATELGLPIPEEPVLFLKPLTTLTDPEGAIRYPPISERVDYECEISIVVKRRGRNVPLDRALDYVLGYTCHNDVTARDLQKKDGQWTRAKSFDTFGPTGPCIATDIDPHDLHIETRLNGQVRQSSNTAQLIFNVSTLVHFISQVMPLLPGDLIVTGTPPGIGPMHPGDIVEVEIERIGVLRNRVIKA